MSIFGQGKPAETEGTTSMLEAVNKLERERKQREEIQKKRDNEATLVQGPDGKWYTQAEVEGTATPKNIEFFNKDVKELPLGQ